MTTPNPLEPRTMRYPDPELLARRCIILTNKRGEPYIAYRSNGLNPIEIWGKPVPYTAGIIFGIPEDVILTFEDFIAPFSIYSPCLQLTSDIPIDAPSMEIKFTPATDAKVHTLRDYGSVVQNKALYHESMVQMRNHSIDKLFKKALKRIGKEEIALDTLERFEVVSVVAKLMCVSNAVVNKALKLPVPPKADGAPNLRITGRQHSFPKSISSEHAYKLKALKAAVQQCRTNMTNRGGTSFVLQDLYAVGEPGGFITRCPVLGVDLAWDEFASYYAPRIGRRNTQTAFTSENVMVMSMLARKMVEGMTVSALPVLLKSRPAMAERFKEWTAKHPPVPNKQIAEAVEEAVKKTQLQKLVDDWEDSEED